ncbi:short-chain dehydrogenase, putative [Talaromyces stipitatus ATCC 10500]|uniref:Short-chain dehydrogenase, putative n=1 Tax=Talaromyces stipitatus (strain ATCC 10500 / CBS 375.48 / QM 6759 / NRRL 1006) TaxID=441959 RepID=B8M8C5_TALSN|nr:short-chain dehydrogenase, putative [Talaromyces stipitatus ATCC 10500]EED20438.1 short-chain dehydrogenase, putative [Talaromyces stipitatus ATCC 10500]
MSKVFFITGAGSGIGRVTARELLLKGYLVFLTDYNESFLEDTCTNHLPSVIPEDKRQNYNWAQMNVCDEEQITNAIALCVEKFGGIDVLSQYMRSGIRMDNVPTSDFEKVLSVNLIGTYRVSQEAIPHLEKSPNGGVIINMSSCRATQQSKHGEAYAASKAGIEGLSMAMAVSLGPKIRVHVISPGMIDVRSERNGSLVPPPEKLRDDLNRDYQTEYASEWGTGTSKSLKEAHPVGRIGRGEDIARPRKSPSIMADSVTLHGRSYAIPRQPTVIICVDGFDPEYLTQGISDGIIPNLARFVQQGFHATVNSCMPSFTNPNNVSIITGQPPAVHGIAGNFFLDRETGKEKMIQNDSLLRGSTILEQMSKHGVRVAAITAKDKLRRILAHGLQTSNGDICFSSERAASCTLAENGIEDVEEWIGRKAPSQYSGDLSIYVLDTGIKLLKEKRAQLFYLTLSDYVQHKHAPGSPEANEFFITLDQRIGRLVALGATVAITGDHGMSSKSKDDGKPNILFLEDTLAEKWGSESARVICPITDPFVKHHGALGSFVRVYVKNSINLSDMIDFTKTLPHVEQVLDRKVAAEEYDMPVDREGDFVVISKKNAVIGSRKDEHDLSSIGDHPLRSHGGLSEQQVPLLLSRPVADVEGAKAKDDWRNYDVLDLALNW